MAISILKQPQVFTPVYNPIMIILDSDKKSETNFQYIIDVLINGTEESRLKVQSTPDGYGVVNIQKHVEPFVTFDLSHTETDIFQKIPNSYTKYSVALSEEYLVINPFTGVTNNSSNTQYDFSNIHYYEVGDKVNISGSSYASYDGVQTVDSVPNNMSIVTTTTYVSGATGNITRADSSNTIITGSTAISGSTYANNTALKWLNYPSFLNSDYTLGTGTTGEFLSSIPRELTVRTDDRLWMNFYNGVSNEGLYLKVVSDTGTFHITNPYYTSNDTQKFIQVGVGPWNLNNSGNTVSVISGALPIVNQFTTQYTVTLINGFSADTSETLTFNMFPQPCTRFDNHKMIYLDHKGSWQSVNFQLANKKKVSTKKTDYIANYGGYNASTNEWTYNSYDRGKSRLDTDITESYTIQTDWVDEATGSQVIELIQSPEVYHLTNNDYTWAYNTPIGVNTISNNGGYIQVNVTTHNYLQGDRVLLENFGSSYNINGIYTITSIVSTGAFVIDRVYQSVAYTGTEQVSNGYITGNVGGELLAVNIDTNSLEEKTKNKTKMINYSVNFEYAFKNVIQRG